MGYMVGYEPYSSGYLIWYPGSKQVNKARDVLFHEEAIAPAMPTLYGDNDAPYNVNTCANAGKITNAPDIIPKPLPRLIIRIPPCVKAPLDPTDQGHASISEEPKKDDEPIEQDTSKIVSNVPDFLSGTMRLGKQHGDIQSLITSDEQFDNPIIMSVNIMGEPSNIHDALNLPGEEGQAWEHARQREWENMINHNVFSEPEKPPPNTQVLKTGTVLCSTCHNGVITKRKVQIVAKGYSQVPGLHYNETYTLVI